MKASEVYYEKAMQTIRAVVPNIEFLVFSDDVEWCKGREMFNTCAFYEAEEGADHMRDLFVMSQCAHHIIANSSFSWWGAWWNWYPGKVVVAPQTWLYGWDSRELGIVPPHWITA